jgi:hypothetical protein
LVAAVTASEQAIGAPKLGFAGLIAVLSVGVALGLFALAGLPIASRLTKGLLMVVYVPVASYAAAFGALITACLFGDCI